MGALRPLSIAAAAVVAAALLPATAGAHAFLVRSEPADASSLSGVPREVRLWFNEPVRSEFTRVDLRALQGTRVPVTSISIAGREVALTLPPLPHGTYSVDFTTLSVDDGHLSKGVVVFGAGTRVVVTDRPGPARPLLLEVALRWLNLIVVTVLVGALAVVRFVVDPAGAAGVRQRVLVTAAGAVVLALPLGAALYVWQVSRLAQAISGSPFELAWRLSQSRWGAVWLGREVILVLLALLIVRALRRGRDAWPVAALLVLGLVCAQALAGHASSLSSSRGLAVLGNAAHLLGASIWIGGLVGLIVGLHGQPRGLVYRYWRRFAALAAAGVGALAVSGLYLLGRQVATPDAVVTTVYGRVLLAKTVLLLVAGVLGLCSFLALHRRAARAVGRMLGRASAWSPVRVPQVPQIAVVEAGVGVAILLAAAVLTSTVPARGPEFSPAPAPPRQVQAASVDDLFVVTAIKPNRPGENVYDVRVAGTRRPPPAPIGRVRLLFVAADGRRLVTPPLRAMGDGRYRLGGGELVRSGPWRVDALVDRAGMPTARASFQWSVGAAGPPRRVVLSDRPLGPIVTRVAAGAAAVLLLLVALLARRGIRPRSTRPLASARLERRPL